MDLEGDIRRRDHQCKAIHLTKDMAKTNKVITGEQCILKGDDGVLVISGVN